jgi:hypothetical protein
MDPRRSVWIGRQPFWDGVEALVKRGARLDKPVGCGDVLLCMASAAGVTTVVDCLLAAKANINFADPNVNIFLAVTCAPFFSHLLLLSVLALN